MDANWRTRLVDLSAAHNIKLSQSEIETINKSDDHSPLARWTDENLSANPMLTPEEVRIWQHLKGKPPRAANVNQEAQPATNALLTESDIRDAINSLEASTRAIEKHATILEQQRSLMNAYREQDGTRPSDISSFKQVLRRKQDREIQQLKLMNAEALSSLETTIGEAEDKVKREAKSIPSAVAEKLKSDDRVLDSLESFLSHDEIKYDTVGISSQQQRIDTLNRALQYAMTSSLRHRLDRIYLEELHSDDILDRKEYPDEAHSIEDEGHIIQLQDDLQTLYAEIDDVAAMVVEHEHGDPLRAALNTLKSEQGAKKQDRILQAHRQIASLTNSLEELADSYEVLHSYRVTIHQMRQSLQEIRLEKDRSKVAWGQKPHKQQQHHTKIDGTTTAYTGTSPGPALTALLRHLNIDYHSAASHDKGSEPEGLSRTFSYHGLSQSPLSKSTQQKSSLIETTLSNMISSIEQTVASSTATTAILSSSQHQHRNDQNLREDDDQESKANKRRAGRQNQHHQHQHQHQQQQIFGEEIARLKELDERVSKSKEAVEIVQLQLQLPTNQHQYTPSDQAMNDAITKASTARSAFVRNWERKKAN